MSAARQAKAAGRARAPFGELDAAICALDPEAVPGELAKQVVETARAQLPIAGARLWRVVEGAPVVWQESGKLPPPDADGAEKALTGRGRGERNGQGWSGAFGPEGQRLGLLELRSGKPIGAEARRLLELYGRYAGAALESSERRSTVAELSTIVEATKRLNSTLDLGELINIILQLATRQTGADRGTVFLADRERDEIWSLVGLGLAQQEIRIPMAKGIAGWVARHGETVNLADAYEDQRFERDVDRRLGYRTRTVLCLPIRNKDKEIVGVLQLLNKKGGRFTAADEGFLRALSDHVALALENAQLHRERLAKQKMERDLALARSIQLGLLPEAPPRLEGFDFWVSHRPTLTVGGDYYDFLPLGPGTLLTVVADVEGKGVASAMVMANLQATLRALVAHLHSLERLVSSLNDMMLEDTRGQKYLTMFIMLVDLKHKALHYVNAGHVPPIVVRPNGNHEQLRDGGMVIGMFPGNNYDRGHIRLAAGDIFVACTDGITEAMDVQAEEYGLERLADAVFRHRALPAQEIVSNVLAEVDKFSLGGPHEDDRVLLILKVQ